MVFFLANLVSTRKGLDSLVRPLLCSVVMVSQTGRNEKCLSMDSNTFLSTYGIEKEKKHGMVVCICGIAFGICGMRDYQS